MFVTPSVELLRIRLHWVASVLLVAAVLGPTKLTYASAIDEVREFRIERASLDHVLLEIAQQAGRPISMRSDVLENRLAGPVVGVMSLAAAVHQALSGTNLMLAELPDGTLTVVSAKASLAPSVNTLLLAPTEVHGALNRGFAVFSSPAVTGTETPIMDAPQFVAAVSNAQLVNGRQASVAEALRDSGVAPITADLAYAPQFDLRGFTANTTYINGERDRLSNFRPLDAVESLAIVKGPSSGLVGLAPPGGAISVDLKAPVATVRHSVSAEIGSYGERKGVADLGGPLGEHGLSYRMVAVEDTSTNSPGGYSGHRLGYGMLALGWHDGITEITAGTETISSRQPLMPSTVALDGRPLRIPSTIPLGNASDGTEAHGSRLYFDASQALTEEWTWHSRVQYQQLTMLSTLWGAAPDTQTSTQVAEVKVAYRIPDQGWSLSNELAGTLHHGALSHALTLGWDEHQWRRDVLSSLDHSFVMQNLFTPEPLPAVVFTPSFNSSHSVRQSVFRLQDRVTIGQRWELLASVRANDYVAKLPFSQDAGLAWTPAFNMLYKLTPQTSVFGGYGRSFDINPIYTDNRTPIAPERGGEWEMGIRWSDVNKKFLAQAALFRANARNVSVFDEQHPGAYLQVDSEISQGAELLLQGALSSAVETSMAVTYTHVSAIMQGQSSGPEHTLRVNTWTNYTVHGGLADGAGFGLGLHGRTASIAYNGNGPRIPGDLLADINIFLSRKRWRLDLGVRNLFNSRAYGETQSSIFIPILTGRAVTLRLTSNL
ncbi:ligand-gated channel [Ralstonia pickettii]|uniref:Ligand-gated channel n=1 Tax=Ralstonia pickettii TaxID=329 RepID=A0A2N4TLM4_RALPI|nr:TonB-dependent receptor [Ralstonia pickettii]PLC40602.1 ligand-gated channel [Ralstonia pickettii]